MRQNGPTILVGTRYALFTSFARRRYSHPCFGGVNAFTPRPLGLERPTSGVLSLPRAQAAQAPLARVARALGIDPLEIRLLNAFGESACSSTAQILQSVAICETLEKAAERFGWKENVP